MTFSTVIFEDISYQLLTSLSVCVIVQGNKMHGCFVRKKGVSRGKCDTNDFMNTCKCQDSSLAV